jgi:hypothetical protein
VADTVIAVVEILFIEVFLGISMNKSIALGQKMGQVLDHGASGSYLANSGAAGRSPRPTAGASDVAIERPQ